MCPSKKNIASNHESNLINLSIKYLQTSVEKQLGKKSIGYKVDDALRDSSYGFPFASNVQ